VAQLESLLTDQPANPLRPEQMQQYEGELSRLGAITQAPTYVQGDRGEAGRVYRRVKQMVDSQRPKPLDGDRASKVHALARSIRDDIIVPSMLPQAVMRRNPPGAVDAFLKRENAKPVKRAVSAYKRAMFALDPETTDIDHANLEKYRPSGVRADGTSTWDADAQIGGFMAMTPQAKDNWPLGDPTLSTAVGQVKAREKTKKVYTEAEKKVLGDRLAAGRAAKKAKREQGAA
jgi:hypothetical protein